MMNYTSIFVTRPDLTSRAATAYSTMCYLLDSMIEFASCDSGYHVSAL